MSATRQQNQDFGRDSKFQLIDQIPSLSSLHSAISNQNNKARLQLLEKREELLEKVFEDARAKIGETTKDEKKYAILLKDLILQVRSQALEKARLSARMISTLLRLSQALFTIMEKDIKVSGRKKDSKLLSKAAEDAAKEFEEKAGWAAKVSVEEDLSDKS